MGSPEQLRLLLDTHIWLWSLLEPARLGSRLRETMEDGATDLWLSPISVWEALLLIERGRVEVDGDARSWVERALVAMPLRDAPLSREVAIRSRLVGLPHPDPADRFIAATAAIHELTLATADQRLLASADLATMANV